MTIAVPSLRAAIISGGTPSWVPRLDGVAADLVLDFANQRGWQSRRPVTDASLVAVTRATTTSYGRNAAGVYVPYSANTIRYDDVLGGALIEPSGTNLCLQSSSLDSVTWTKPADVTITANSTTGVFGTATADTVTCDGTGGGGLFQTITVSASTTYTWSFFAKLGTLSASDYKFAVYDVTNAAFIGLNLVPSTLPTTTEWTLVSYTFTTPALCVLIRVYPLRNSATISGTIYVEQCQLEAGAFGTSPIPTTTAAVTRAADVLSCTLPVALQNQSAYTTLVACTPFAPSSYANSQVISSLDNGTTSERIQLYRISGSALGAVYVAGVAQTEPGGQTFSSAAGKIAFAHTLGSSALSVNGSAVGTATPAGHPSITALHIGNRADGANGVQFNGVIASVAVWASRRTNAAIQGATA